MKEPSEHMKRIWRAIGVVLTANESAFVVDAGQKALGHRVNQDRTPEMS